MARARVLITGFEPFGGFHTNPAQEVARAMGRQQGIAAHILPVEFDQCVPQITELVGELRPQVALCLGLAPTREVLSLERVAINLIDARIPDEAGRQPVDVPVIEEGPAAYFTTLPVKAMRRAAESAGISAELSLSAGTYGCNAVMYAALHAAGGGTRAGFVHLPPAASLSLAESIRAVTAMVHCALQTQVDDAEAGGTID